MKTSSIWRSPPAAKEPKAVGELNGHRSRTRSLAAVLAKEFDAALTAVEHEMLPGLRV